MPNGVAQNHAPPTFEDVRVADLQELLQYLMEMRGKTMRGWLRVDSADVSSDGDLAAWVERGAAYARSLPAKG